MDSDDEPLVFQRDSSSTAWNNLLNNVEVKREPQGAAELGVDKSSSRADSYTKLSDNELKAKVTRLRYVCQSASLVLFPDGGKKLRSQLKHLETELKRRISIQNRIGTKHAKLKFMDDMDSNDAQPLVFKRCANKSKRPENDDKCKGATLIDGLTCGSSTRTPLDPTSSFLSKLAGDKLKHGAAKHHEKVPLLPVDPIDDDGGGGGDIPNSNPQVASQTQLPGVTGQGSKRKGVEFPACSCQKRPNNTIAAPADEIAQGSTVLPNVVPQKDATRAKPSSIQRDFSIPECLSILRRMPEVEEGGALFLYATMLFMKPVEREMFVCLEKDDVRLKWLGYLMERDAQGRTIS